MGTGSPMTGSQRVWTGTGRPQIGPGRARTGPGRAQTGPGRHQTGPGMSQLGPREGDGDKGYGTQDTGHGTQKICPVWFQRSSAPLEPLPRMITISIAQVAQAITIVSHCHCNINQQFTCTGKHNHKFEVHRKPKVGFHSSLIIFHHWHCIFGKDGLTDGQTNPESER